MTPQEEVRILDAYLDALKAVAGDTCPECEQQLFFCECP